MANIAYPGTGLPGSAFAKAAAAVQGAARIDALIVQGQGGAESPRWQWTHCTTTE